MSLQETGLPNWRKWVILEDYWIHWEHNLKTIPIFLANYLVRAEVVLYEYCVKEDKKVLWIQDLLATQLIGRV